MKALYIDKEQIEQYQSQFDENDPQFKAIENMLTVLTPPTVKAGEEEQGEEFLLHLIDVVACDVMEQSMYLATDHRRKLIQKAKETFTPNK